MADGIPSVGRGRSPIGDRVLEGLAPFGQALLAYHLGDTAASLSVRWDLGDERTIPVSTFFEPPGADSLVEGAVVTRAEGTVLDVGAGSGRFSRALIDLGLSVTAVDWLPEAVRVLRERQIPVVHGDFRTPGLVPPADTVVVLMNGTTLAGSMGELPSFLESLFGLVRPGGRILIDSTDPGHPGADWGEPLDGRDPGELHLQMGFGGRWGPPIPQLFVGPARLDEAASQVGMECTVITAEKGGRFLAELTSCTGL